MTCCDLLAPHCRTCEESSTVISDILLTIPNLFRSRQIVSGCLVYRHWPSYFCDMSCRVTAAYAEESTVARFTIGHQATVHDLKQRACSELAKTAQHNYGLANGFPTGDMASIVLSSGIPLFSPFLFIYYYSHMLLRFAWSTQL